MYDVARLAGVSHQTVSRVINGSKQVRPETRDRVLEAMEQLNYRPNSVARALVTGRSRTLGVVTFDTSLYGPASTLVGVERAAHEQGYFVSVVSLEVLERSAVLRAVERLRALSVDGILVIAPHVAAASALWDLPEDLPVVAVEAGPEDAVPLVTIDQYHGAKLATEHLLGLGHATAHHIAGPGDWYEAQQRVDGWRDALEAAGAQSPALRRGDWSPRSGYEIGRELLEQRGVTAVFAGNDQMALGLLHAYHEAGRTVPGEVSIVGFDDIPEAAYFSPPLTTVRQDFNEMGRNSLHLLLEEIEATERSLNRLSVTPTLVERASTAAP
jgi:DNA-binding LacI/PurR family transcriptional regulator